MQKHLRNQKIKAMFALLVTSDVRSQKTDETGKIARHILENDGHSILSYILVRNETQQIKKAIQNFLDDEKIQVIITSGGTGISPKDNTVDVVSRFFEKEIDGFGEMFRSLSYNEIGEAAIISRAKAGVAQKKLVFCVPGSTGAMNLALSKIILPVLGHMMWEIKRT